MHGEAQVLSIPLGAHQAGPTEEAGIALAPDGRSLITSVGTRQSAIWMHDATGERPISSEGYASAPRLSRDGKRVFDLLQQKPTASSAELRSVDLASGKSEGLLPGLLVTDYDISRDEKEVVFTTTPSGGVSQIWLASLDGRSAPRQITSAGDQVSFGANGTLVFRLLESKVNFLYRINTDRRERIVDTPILNKFSVSPDGEWVVAFAPAPGEDASSETGRTQTVAVPVRGGATKKICSGICASTWSSDGSVFYVVIEESASATPGTTLAIPVPAGKSVPDLPAAGISPAAVGAELPRTLVIEQVLCRRGATLRRTSSPKRTCGEISFEYLCIDGRFALICGDLEIALPYALTSDTPLSGPCRPPGERMVHLIRSSVGSVRDTPPTLRSRARARRIDRRRCRSA